MNFENYLAQWRQAATLAQKQGELEVVNAAEQGFKSGGERGMFEAMLKTQQKLYAEGEASPYVVAATAARLGRKDEALRYLQAAYRDHDADFLSLRLDEPFIGLHDDPEFRRLVQLAESAAAAVIGSSGQRQQFSDILSPQSAAKRGS